MTRAKSSSSSHPPHLRKLAGVARATRPRLERAVVMRSAPAGLRRRPKAPPSNSQPLTRLPAFAGGAPAPHDGAALGSAGCHNLLRQNIQRRIGNHQPVQISLPDGSHQRGAFQQIVARAGEKASLGHCAPPVAGPSDALQCHCNRPRRTDLHHQVHGANIDSQFQRCCGHQNLDFAFFELLSPRRDAACATGCRDARQRCLRPVVRPGGERCAPPAAGYSRTPAWNDAARPVRPAGCRFRPTFRWW